MLNISRPVAILILIVAAFIGLSFLAYAWHVTDVQDVTLTCQESSVNIVPKAVKK